MGRGDASEVHGRVPAAVESADERDLPEHPGHADQRRSYLATNAEISPSLGRNLGSCGGRVPCTGTATFDLFPNRTSTKIGCSRSTCA